MIKAISDKKFEVPCSACCLTSKCSGAADLGHQVINGKDYYCDKDAVYYVEDNSVDINDLKKTIKMLVWVHDKDKHEAMVVYIHGDGSVIDISGNSWPNYEEIKDPVFRPYQKGDDVDFLCGHKVRSKNSRAIMLISGVHNDNTIDNFIINSNWRSFEKLFNEYENVDGSPLGVKL